MAAAVAVGMGRLILQRWLMASILGGVTFFYNI